MKSLNTNKPDRETMASSSAVAMSDVRSQTNAGSSPRRVGAAGRGGRNEEGEDADAEGGAPRKRGPKTRVARDQGNIPAVRDDTGEEVMRLFESFLEK